MTIFIVATMVGVFFATVGSLMVRPDRPLTTRFRPYAQYSRSRLGAEVDVDAALATQHTSGSMVSFISNPLRVAALTALEVVLDVTEEPDELTLRLRRAGIGTADPASYRSMQLRVGGIAAVIGALGSWWLGSSTGRSAVVWAIVGAAMGFSAGAILFRLRLASMAESRSARLKLEAYSVAALLSVAYRAGFGPIAGLRRVGRRANGEMTEDLDRGFQWLARGSSSREALERLAAESPDPATSRIYRLLATSADTGLNPATGMRQLADELRKVRQEELDQLATKRRSAMLIPTMFFMLPVIVLYALAPGPSVLFGL